MWVLCPDGTNMQQQMNLYCMGLCIAAIPDPARDFSCATGRITSQAAQPMYVPMCMTPCLPIHIQLTYTFECGGSFASWRALQWCALVVCSLNLFPITAMLTYMYRLCFCSPKLPSWLACSHFKGVRGLSSTFIPFHQLFQEHGGHFFVPSYTEVSLLWSTNSSLMQITNY